MNQTKNQILWFYIAGKEQIGPISQQDIATKIASGEISKDTWVWREGMANWMTLEHTELAIYRSQLYRKTPQRSSGEAWFYISEGKQTGPVPHSVIQEKIDKGTLKPETLVWSKEIVNWTPVNDVAAFECRNSPAGSSFASTQRYSPAFGHPLTDYDRSLSQVRPWIRYWARMFDLCFFGFLMGIALVFIHPRFVFRINFNIIGIVELFLWIFVETTLLTLWGNTPGKKLFKIKVRKSTGGQFNYFGILSRSFNVWIRGLALGIPLASLITLILSYNKLKNEGITSWDRDGGFVVEHGKIGALRGTIGILLFVVFFSLMAVGLASNR